jgi:hypothetical protein
MCDLPIEERWVSIPLGGVPMEKINLPFFYQLGSILKPLAEMEAGKSKRLDIYLASSTVSSYVRNLLSAYPTLIVCRDSGEQLIKATGEILTWLQSTPHADWEKEDPISLTCSQLLTKAKEFQTVLSAELLKLETYYVSQKGIYDTTALITRTENVLPISMLNKIDQKVVVEIRESGKCLAFDCATASGFHIMRATELILHKYYIHICNPKSKKRLANWGAYIDKLEQSQDPEVGEVVTMLRQIKNSYRNIIMHPTMVLSSDKAFTLFVIAQGAIVAMVGKLPKGEGQ